MLRQILPPGFVADPAGRATLRQGFAAALQAFLDHLSVDETLEVLLRNRVRVQGVPADGHLAQLDALPALRLGSRLGHRPGLLCMVEADEQFATIRFGTQSVQAPARIRSALEFVRVRASFAVAEIPGLDDGGKLVLARRLVAAGLLRVLTLEPPLTVRTPAPASGPPRCSGPSATRRTTRPVATAPRPSACCAPSQAWHGSAPPSTPRSRRTPGSRRFFGAGTRLGRVGGLADDHAIDENPPLSAAGAS